MAIVFLLLPAAWLSASAGTWDAVLSNSNWYVPEENLLAIMSSGTNLADNTAVWDQTLWSLGTATEGLFTGTARATFYVVPGVSFSSTNTIHGLATEAGQIRMRFTSTSGTIIGIGQFRQTSGTTAIEMQMISGGADTAYTTHWASMLPYDPATFTPPDPLPNALLTSPEWAWTRGTTWSYRSDELFGPGGTGSFTITDYRNGYFWGTGQGPAGSPGETFSQLGSITPEGNVLFNVLTGASSPTLTTLTGLVTGGPADGMMALRTYEFSGSEPVFGPVGIATVVPEPSVWLLAATGIAIAGAKALRRRRRGGVAGVVLVCAIGTAARADFDWTRAEALAPGVSLGTMALTLPARPGLTCPQTADFDPEAPRPVAIACARVDLAQRGLSFEATPRAADWGRPMPPHGDTEFPGMVIRTALQTVPDFAAAERGAGIPVVLAVNASPWEPFVPGKAFAHADRLGLVVDDGVVVSPPAAGRPSLLIRRDGTAEMRVVGADDDLAGIETAVSGFSFCLVDGAPSPPDTVLHPRTGFGLSADRRVLYILVADGRQAASRGLTVREVGELLRDLGADDGINMDGGGSTTLVAGATAPRLVNRPSGRLRRNGANLAIAVGGDGGDR